MSGTDLPTAAYALRAATLILMPFKLIPSTYWFLYEIDALMDTNSWTSPLDLFTHLGSVFSTLWANIGVWLSTLAYLPVDIFILYESFYWDDALKTSDAFSLWFIRIMSWVVLSYSLFQSLTYGINAIIVDIQTGSLTEVMKKTIVKVLTSVFALAPAFSYFFEINAYSNYL